MSAIPEDSETFTVGIITNILCGWSSSASSWEQRKEKEALKCIKQYLVSKMKAKRVISKVRIDHQVALEVQFATPWEAINFHNKADQDPEINKILSHCEDKRVFLLNREKIIRKDILRASRKEECQFWAEDEQGIEENNRRTDDDDNDGDDEDKDEDEEDDDDDHDHDKYFEAYNEPFIHYVMLHDEIRMNSYGNAILNNPQLFKGKIVMDVGSGTGILSLMAAQAGAAKVLAVEVCPTTSAMSVKVFERNGYKDVIEAINKKLEDITELDQYFKKVDVIISEWMGYVLIYESMLKTVLFARDKYLKPGGIMLPDRARIMAAAVCDEWSMKGKFQYFNQSKEWGYDFADLTDARKLVMEKPIVQSVLDDEVVSKNYVVIHEISLETVEASTASQVEIIEMYYDIDHELLRQRSSEGEIHGLVLFFEVDFTHGENIITLSTSPDFPPTHWMQVVLFFETPLKMRRSHMMGLIQIRHPKKRPRGVEIRLKVWEKNRSHHRKVEKFILS